MSLNIGPSWAVKPADSSQGSVSQFSVHYCSSFFHFCVCLVTRHALLLTFFPFPCFLVPSLPLWPFFCYVDRTLCDLITIGIFWVIMCGIFIAMLILTLFNLFVFCALPSLLAHLVTTIAGCLWLWICSLFYFPLFHFSFIYCKCPCLGGSPRNASCLCRVGLFASIPLAFDLDGGGLPR